MGMYDTFIFKESLYCPYCGTEHKEIQTKVFRCTLNFYNVGDIVKGADTEIVRQELYCLSDKCWKNKRSINRYGITFYFYIVIENGIYIGVAPSLDNAEDLLSTDDYELIS